MYSFSVCEPPKVATSITAGGGRYRYRVYAYRPLSHAELVDTVRHALKLGWIDEPPEGGESVLFTSIGVIEHRRARRLQLNRASTSDSHQSTASG